MTSKNGSAGYWSTWTSPPLPNTPSQSAIDLSEIYKPTQPGAYPIILASYEIVCSKHPDPEVGKAVKALLQATITTGHTNLNPIG
jgi:phosphate transport system substrate-binding protein